jgi:hypothetical protein
MALCGIAAGACGDDNGNGIILHDGGTLACDPVKQTGCIEGEKCTYVIEQTMPVLGRTACIPDGTVAEGAVCQFVSGKGYDDCQKGLYCINGRCSDICSIAPNSCDGARVCALFASLFEDADGIGACLPGCNPVAQDCEITGQGCYLLLSAATEAAACIEPFQEGQHWAPCDNLNDCSKGFGCNVKAAPGSMDTVCAAYCDPTGSGGPTCADLQRPSYYCGLLTTSFNPPVGACIDPEIHPLPGGGADAGTW